MNEYFWKEGTKLLYSIWFNTVRVFCKSSANLFCTIIINAGNLTMNLASVRNNFSTTFPCYNEMCRACLERTWDVCSKGACITSLRRICCCFLIRATSAFSVCSSMTIEQWTTMRTRVMAPTNITLLQRQNFDSISLTTITKQLVQAPVSQSHSHTGPSSLSHLKSQTRAVFQGKTIVNNVLILSHL